MCLNPKWTKAAFGFQFKLHHVINFTVTRIHKDDSFRWLFFDETVRLRVKSPNTHLFVRGPGGHFPIQGRPTPLTDLLVGVFVWLGNVEGRSDLDGVPIHVPRANFGHMRGAIDFLVVLMIKRISKLDEIVNISVDI